jgi:signal transduction histidine kinase
MKFRHRLSGKLIMLFLLLGLLIALVVRTGFRIGIQDEFRNLATPHLLEYIAHLQEEIGNPPDRQRAKALAQRLDMDITILSPNDRWSSGSHTADLNEIHFHQHQLKSGEAIEVGKHDHHFYLRLQQGAHTLLLSPSKGMEESQLPLIVSLTIVAVLAIIALLYHLVRRIFRPIETIRQDVTRFGQGDLGHRITIKRRDELGELAQSINNMASEIEQMLEGKRQLLLAISHELRSPLTRARVNAELIDESEPRQRIIQDLQQMELELTELLETERLGSRHAKLEREEVSPAALVDDVLARHFSETDVVYRHLNDSKNFKLDSVRVRLLMRNLLDNALRHTPTGAEPPILTSEGSRAAWRLTVEDHGEGIEAEHLDQITQPFYRTDKARQRETGGYGLGLYLCKVIAEAHGGRLQIESEVGKGTRVSASFPVRS